MTSEEQARKHIDALLLAVGWHICDVADANIHAALGVAIREFPLDSGFGFADYLLYVDGKACGVIEAKKEGMPLTGVEVQSGRYAKGLPASLPAWRRPLPFIYESTVYNLTFDGSLNHRHKPAFISQETHAGELARLKTRSGDVLINIVGPPLGFSCSFHNC